MNKDTEARDKKIAAYLQQLHKIANSAYVIDESDYSAYLDDIFDSNMMGYREIVFTIAARLHYDSKYQASKDWGAGSPRSIYENIIKMFFADHHIPHGKSGPLNVAKGTMGINRDWAEKRRDPKAAMAAVRVVEYLERHPDRRDDVSVSLMRRFLACAVKAQTATIKTDPEADPYRIHGISKSMIDETPNKGNTPQTITVDLALCWCDETPGVSITGVDDCASVTNASGGKPGDFAYVYEGTSKIKPVEVTVKPFDMNRLHDSYDSIKAYEKENNTRISKIDVICRPRDCPDFMKKAPCAGTVLGSYTYRDVEYRFVDIYAWIWDVLSSLSESGRKRFHQMLDDYFAHYNISLVVKNKWSGLHKAA